MAKDPSFRSEHLRELRYAAGMSQAELAHRAGLSVTTVSRLECAANTPSLPTIHLLARALSVEPSELLRHYNGSTAT